MKVEIQEKKIIQNICRPIIEDQKQTWTVKDADNKDGLTFESFAEYCHYVNNNFETIVTPIKADPLPIIEEEILVQPEAPADAAL